MTLGEKIISLRRARGLSQEDLAITLGVSRQAVSKWETGDATPDTDKVVALANYFAVTTDWLLRDIEPERAPAQKSNPLTQQRFAPMLLCIDWCGAALGLIMSVYGLTAASEWPSLIGLMLLVLCSILPVGSSMMMRQEDETAGRDFLRRFWQVNIWLVMFLPFLWLGGSRLIAQLIPTELIVRVWYLLPEPLWELGRLAVFAALPLALYVAVCLFVTLRLRKKSK